MNESGVEIEISLMLSMLVTVPRLQRVPALKETMRNLAIDQPSMGIRFPL